MMSQGCVCVFGRSGVGGALVIQGGSHTACSWKWRGWRHGLRLWLKQSCYWKQSFYFTPWGLAFPESRKKKEKKKEKCYGEGWVKMSITAVENCLLKKKKKLNRIITEEIPFLCTQIDREQMLEYTHTNVQSILFIEAERGGQLNCSP